MKADRKIAIIVGVLYIIGTVAGVLSLVLAGSILDDPNYLTEISANENQILIGAIFFLTMGFSLAMVPVLLFPIFKKHNEALAVGYVVFRGASETMIYLAGVVTWLLLLTLSREYVDSGTPDASYFQTLGNLLHEASAWIDLISTINFSLGALMISYIFYQSKLVPVWLSVWGLISATLVLAVGLFGMFDVNLQVLWAPLAVQEMVMALWLIIKGFSPSKTVN